MAINRVLHRALVGSPATPDLQLPAPVPPGPPGLGAGSSSPFGSQLTNEEQEYLQQPQQPISLFNSLQPQQPIPGSTQPLQLGPMIAAGGNRQIPEGVRAALGKQRPSQESYIPSPTARESLSYPGDREKAEAVMDSYSRMQAAKQAEEDEALQELIRIAKEESLMNRKINESSEKGRGMDPKYATPRKRKK